MSTPSKEALALAADIQSAYYDPGRYGLSDDYNLMDHKAREDLGLLIDRHISLLLVHDKTFRQVCADLEWMREDPSLGLVLGDRFYFEGIRALKAQRDDLVRKSTGLSTP